MQGRLQQYLHPPFALDDMSDSDNSKHVVFLQGVGAGHINPTEPLVATMVACGIKVTYFASSIETTLGRADPVSEAMELLRVN